MSETRACGLGAKMRHALCSVTHCHSVFPNFCRDTIAAELARYWFPWCSFLAWPSLQCLMHACTCLCTRQLYCSPHVCFCVCVKKKKKRKKTFLICFDFMVLFCISSVPVVCSAACFFPPNVPAFEQYLWNLKKSVGLQTDIHSQSHIHTHSLTLRFLEVCIMLAKNQHFLSSVVLEKCELKF